VAFVGIAAYRLAFGRPQARLGRQKERLAESRIWLLPNPSGLNANYQAKEFARLFTEVRHAAESPQPPKSNDA
jgi:TDG/mug DNA glycosylase family protein